MRKDHDVTFDERPLFRSVSSRRSWDLLLPKPLLADQTRISSSHLVV
jgi:hypothetical protein